MSKYSIADVSALNVIESGTIILPTDYLGEKAFTLNDFTAGVDIVKIVSEKTTEEDGYTVMRAALIKILESNYNRAFSARAYLLIEYANGYTDYVYTDYNEENNSRSIYFVAKAVREDGYVNLSERQIAMVDNYIAVAEGGAL